MDRITLFVDVVLPLPISNLFTYRVPYELNDAIRVGQRVVVQFGKNKMYTALVRRIHEAPPREYSAKYLESILDDEPIVNEKQFRLWEWMSAYYMCAIGEVMNAALPSGLKLASESKIVLQKEFIERNVNNELANALSDEEYLVVEALQGREVLSLNDVSEILDRKNVHTVIKSLLQKNVVLMQEELKEKFKPKVELFVRLTRFAEDEAHMKGIMEDLEKRAFKQLELLMCFLRLRRELKNKEIKKSDLLRVAEASDAVLQGLVKKEIFEVYEEETSRLESGETGSKVNVLSGHQERILDEVKAQLQSKDVLLLHGVTSSGKTELYVKLMAEAIAGGKQVLYLLPEIALTTQLINRLRKYFGNKIGVYHSRFNENERVEVWKGLLDPLAGEKALQRYEIILGARSSLFLPFRDLGLVIVDEEHDTSYKQFDPAPRYHARDAAIYLAHIHAAKTVLGSATPSLESYHNAEQGKYGLASLGERFGGVEMPEIIISDIKEAGKRKEMRSHFSQLLLDHVEAALKQKEQAILFQNRRGFAPMLSCETCGWAPQCVHCDVTLTYHKSGNQLRCHYCGYKIPPPQKCAACGNDRLKLVGFGTEKIEDELTLFFPGAKIARMDLDTTRSKLAYRQIIQDFEERHIDILVGTQMVTKGLDFDNVSVVGILNADSMLNFPDFRAFERSFQLMAQVAGRAGRKNKRGKVIIQTHNPAHPIIRHVVDHDYLAMYREQMKERHTFHYPPFYRLIELTLLHKDIDQVNHSAEFLAEGLKGKLGARVIGPGFPLVSRIRNLYHKNILIKIEKESSVSKVKEILSGAISLFRNSADHKAVRILVDVDPM